LTIPSGHGKIYDVDYRYDTKYLITCGDDKKTKMWNATDGTFIK
jgi:WD40 repeat protein